MNLPMRAGNGSEMAASAPESKSTATADTSAVSEQIKAFSEQHGDKTTVMFSVAAPLPLIIKLLEAPRTASVILAEAPNVQLDLDPKKTGWLRPDGRVAKAPADIGDLILAFGDAEAFGFELSRICLQRGAKRIAFDTPFGFTKPTSLLSLFANRSCRGANRVLRRKVRDLILSGHFGPLDPILGRFYRRLMRPLSTTSRNKRRLARLTRQIKEAPTTSQSIRGRRVLVTGSLGPGGAERQLVNTFQGMAMRGASDMHLLVDLLSPAPHDFYRPILERIDGLELQELGAVSMHNQSDLPDLKRLVRHVPSDFLNEIMTLVSQFKCLRPEVVHAWQDRPCAKAGVAAVLAGVDRIVLSWRSLSPLVTGLYNPCFEPIFKALASRDNVVMLNNSAAGAASYADWLGLDPGRIQVIRNGIDLSHLRKPDRDLISAYRKKLGLPAGAPVVGTVFRFGAEKRPMLWLETAANVAKRRPDVHFLMIGDGPLCDQVKATVSAWGLDYRVHLPGRTTTPALAFAVMDLFLMTSAFEGLPNVLIEAGAIGVPVVSTDVGGVRETFAHGETGFAVKANGPDPLADKIVELLSDSAWRRQAAKLAPIWVRERFDMGRMIDETLAAYGGSKNSEPVSHRIQPFTMATEPRGIVAAND